MKPSVPVCINIILHRCTHSRLNLETRWQANSRTLSAMYKYPLLAFLSSILDLVTSLALSLPDATIHATQIESQRSPAPTIAPYAPLDLIKRAEAYTYGFFDGDANNPDSCDIGYSLFATNNYYTCCSTDSLGFSNANCTIASTCLDFSATNLCDSQQCGPGTLLW